MRWSVLGALACSAACGAPSSRHPQAPVELRILSSLDLGSADPNAEVETFTDSVLFNVYEPLVGLDAGLGPRPMLAQSWEHPSAERWRFRLRRDVRFHDGTPLDASLARDALQALRESKDREAAATLTSVREISAVDAHTLDLVTAEPRGLLTSLPTAYIAHPAPAGSFPPWVGTGPYSLTEWKKGERIVLERAPSHRGPPPFYDRVVYEVVPSPLERLARLESGRADIILDAPVADACRGCRIVRYDGVALYYLVPNVRRPPWQDLRVRRALDQSIDRARVVAAAEGAGRPAFQAVPPRVFGFDPSLPEVGRDPQAARRLLAAAGYAKGLSARLDVSAAHAKLGEALALGLAEAGIRVETHPVDTDHLYEAALAGDSELSLVVWVFSSGETSEFLEFSLHTRRGAHGSNNLGGFSHARLDQITESNAGILDPAERRAVLQEATGILAQELPVIPLFVGQDSYGVRDGIAFRPRADSEIWLADVRPARAP